MIPPFKVPVVITGPRATASGVTTVSSGSTSKFASTLAAKQSADTAASSSASASDSTSSKPLTPDEQGLQTLYEGFMQNASVLPQAEMPDAPED